MWSDEVSYSCRCESSGWCTDTDTADSVCACNAIYNSPRIRILHLPHSTYLPIMFFTNSSSAPRCVDGVGRRQERNQARQ
jgi:hypothetical protein